MRQCFEYYKATAVMQAWKKEEIVISVQLEQRILWQFRNEFHTAEKFVVPYIVFEPRSFRAASYDREAGVRDSPHDLGESLDGYMDALPVQQTTSVEKSWRTGR
jgi:hypothetical protein